MSNKVKITLVRSPIGRLPKHIQTLKTLGLTKMYSIVEHNDNPCVRGMINQIGYLLRVEEYN